MNIVLYSTNCPKCKILKMKLDKARIDYSENTNMDDMINLGFTSAPMLGVDDKYYSFGEAIKFVGKSEKEEGFVCGDQCNFR